MFYLGGIGLASFLTFLLLSKRGKTVADRILGSWLIIITLHLLLFYFVKAKLYPQLLGAAIPLPLMHGPFLYWYTRALTNRKVARQVPLVHFAPALACLLYAIPFLILPTDQKISVFENHGAGYETFNKLNSIAISVSGVLYVILSSLALRRHRLLIMQEFSSTEKINLQWLRYLIYWLGIIWIFVIAGNDDWIFATVVLFIAFIGFFGIRQMGLFNPTELALPEGSGKINSLDKEMNENNPVGEISESRKYQKSGLSPGTSELIHRNLSSLMNNEKLFREAELSLTELARRINTQPNHLSQVINEKEGKHFYDYVNTLRITEFKRLAALPDTRKYTLLALAQECGFSSKSSFNRYCKKVTGKTPSEFLEDAAD